MKKLLSASAAAALLLAAAPAFAGSGYVDASYTNVEDGDLTSLNLGGAAVVEVSNGWNVQGDVLVHQIDDGFFGDKANYTDAGLHLFTRNDSWAAGVYADTTDIFMVSAYGFGVEGAKYFDRATVNGSVGFNTAEGGFFFGGSVDGWNANAGATFFATDNLTLGANVGFFEIDDEDTVAWGVDAEFKPEAMPVSFFAGYSSQDEGFMSGDDVSSWTLGLRWNFGGGSLKDRDRSGASMKGGSGFSDFIF